MTEYNTLNVKLFNSQLKKLKSGIKNGTQVTLKPASNVFVDFNDETNFSHKLLLTNTQISNICKAFAYDLSDNVKFSKTQLSKMLQSGGSFIDSVMNFSNKLILAGMSKEHLPIIAKNITEKFINKKIK